MKLTAQHESWPLKTRFKIARGSKTSAETVCVLLDDGNHRGRGECLPYNRYGETVDGVIALIETLRDKLADGMDRNELQAALPSGAARNALDCALWDLETKQHGARVWDLLGTKAPANVTTAYTLSLDSPAAMQASAKENAGRALLKVKLGGPEDLDCIKAVRAGAPKARLILDANEGWTAGTYESLVPELEQLNIEMIEQPFPAEHDQQLLDVARPIPICADESCHDTNSFDDLLGKYDMINIKLDKTGGLTEALKLRDRAVAEGLQIMVGCMVSTSLSMAPAMLLANDASIVDLDGPLLLAQDRENGIAYRDSMMAPPEQALWG